MFRDPGCADLLLALDKGRSVARLDVLVLAFAGFITLGLQSGQLFLTRTWVTAKCLSNRRWCTFAQSQCALGIHPTHAPMRGVLSAPSVLSVRGTKEISRLWYRLSLLFCPDWLLGRLLEVYRFGPGWLWLSVCGGVCGPVSWTCIPDPRSSRDHRRLRSEKLLISD